jgi:hypothetical protein
MVSAPLRGGHAFHVDERTPENRLAFDLDSSVEFDGCREGVITSFARRNLWESSQELKCFDVGRTDALPDHH